MKRQPTRVVIPAVSSAGSRPAFPQDVRRAVRCTGGRYGIRGDDVRAERLAGLFRRPARFFGVLRLAADGRLEQHFGVSAGA